MLNIVVMCTANQCRSPMAEVIVAEALRRSGVDANVSSVGLFEGGQPAVDNAVAAVADLGLDLSGHVSRQISRPIVESADLILTMERRHAREAAVAAPGALAKSFTFLDFLERSEAAWPANGTIAERVAVLAKDRMPSQLMDTGKDEVPDPIGKDLSVFRDTRDDLVSMARRLAQVLSH